MPSARDLSYMREALALASEAEQAGEVPVGALVVYEGEIIGRGWNKPISGHDPTAHAEIVALRQAAKQRKNYRLPGTALYVTIEPCTMCVGALVHARVDLVVFGAREPRAGAVVSSRQLSEESFYNHRLSYLEGIMAEECGAVLTDFFERKRNLN